jgi:hypothetical protein
MKWWLRGTLDKGRRRRVQWNQTFLLVKSFKLVLRPLDKDPRPRQIKLWLSLHGIILEGKPIGPNQKQELKGELMVWKVQVKVQVCSFFHFLLSFIVFFYPRYSNSSRMEETLWIESLVESTHCKLPHFLSVSLELTWLVLCIFTRWLLGMHF